MEKALHFGINEPLHPSDSETQTYGCRANNLDICRNNGLIGVCAFVRSDGICKLLSRAWKNNTTNY